MSTQKVFEEIYRINELFGLPIASIELGFDYKGDPVVYANIEGEVEEECPDIATALVVLNRIAEESDDD